MKKTLSLISILVLVGAGSSVLAQQRIQSQVQSQKQSAVRDANGDGLCDDCGRQPGSGPLDTQGKRAQNGKQSGPGDGTGNQGKRPQNGTGKGISSGNKSGIQDGTGARMGRQGNGLSVQSGRRGRR